VRDLPGKLGTPAQFLEVDHDDFGVFVFVQVPKEVQLVHVCLVTDRNEFGESEVPVGGKIQDRRAESPALGNKGNVSVSRHACREACVEPD